MARTLTVALCLPAAWSLQVQDADGIRPLDMPEAEDWRDIFVRGVDSSNMVPVEEKGLPGYGDVTIMGYPPDEDREISESLAKTDGEWETYHLSGLCEPFANTSQGNFLDVGANIGTYTLPMASCVRGKGVVIAVEAMPDIANHLRAGIDKNKAKNVVLYNYAVGERSDPKGVTMLLNETNRGASFVAGNKPVESGMKDYTVPLTTLDSILRSNPRMKAVLSAKVDIEGNEGRMLKGAEELFSKHPPCYLTIELIPEWLDSAGTPVDGVLQKLLSWGYVRVPPADYLRTARWRSKTIHVHQKDLGACRARVASESDGAVRL